METTHFTDVIGLSGNCRRNVWYVLYLIAASRLHASHDEHAPLRPQAFLSCFNLTRQHSELSLHRMTAWSNRMRFKARLAAWNHWTVIDAGIRSHY